jgi:hypothetical protein
MSTETTTTGTPEAAPGEPTAQAIETAKRLQHCAITASDWLAGGCDVHDIPRPQIAALATWTKETIAEVLALEQRTIGDLAVNADATSDGVGGWLPISTAPLDGTNVDLWVAGPCSGDGTRQTDCWFEKGRWWKDYGRDGTDQPGAMVGDVPVFWMRIPSPPNVRAERAPTA